MVVVMVVEFVVLNGCDSDLGFKKLHSFFNHVCSWFLQKPNVLIFIYLFFKVFIFREEKDIKWQQKDIFTLIF